MSRRSIQATAVSWSIKSLRSPGCSVPGGRAAPPDPPGLSGTCGRARNLPIRIESLTNQISGRTFPCLTQTGEGSTRNFGTKVPEWAPEALLSF